MARRLPPGIARTRRGYRVSVRVRLGRRLYQLRSKRFPRTASLDAMKSWREDQRVAARQQGGPRPEAGTLAADIECYLDQVKAMKTYRWRERDLAAWRVAFGDLPRAKIAAGMIRAQLHTWRTDGPQIRFAPRTKRYREVKRPLSASACNHRRTALLHLWTLLDGKGAPNPVRDVPPFREPPAQPRALPIALLLAAIARIRSVPNRARAAVLLWTGIRGNSELALMTPGHVDFARRECHVPTGKGGQARVVPLTVAGVEAWREFARLKLWGPYDKDALRKSVQRAVRREAKARGLTAPAARAYDLRHSFATALLQAGADLADVQDVLGHSTPRMTRRYAPFQRAKVIAALDRIADNLSPPIVSTPTDQPANTGRIH